MAEVSVQDVPQPGDQPFIDSGPEAYNPAGEPSQGALDSSGALGAPATPASPGADYANPNAEEGASGQDQNPLGYTDAEGDFSAGPVGIDAEPNPTAASRSPGGEPEASTPADLGLSGGLTTPVAGAGASSARATPSGSSRSPRRGGSAGGASAGRASSASSSRGPGLGKPPPPPLSIASPTAFTAAASPQPGALGTATGSARGSGVRPGSHGSQHRLSLTSGAPPQLQDEAEAQNGPDAPLGPGPEQTPQGGSGEAFDPEAVDLGQPPEADQGPAEDQDLVPYQPLYNPEGLPNEGVGSDPSALEGQEGGAERQQRSYEGIDGPEPDGLGPQPSYDPEPAPDQGAGQGFEGEQEQQQPQLPPEGQEEEEAAQSADGAWSPSAGDQEEEQQQQQQQPGGVSFEAEADAGPEGETPSGQAFITEARVKRGIPRFPPPQQPQQPQQQEEEGQQQGQEASWAQAGEEGYIEPGSPGQEGQEGQQQEGQQQEGQQQEGQQQEGQQQEEEEGQYPQEQEGQQVQGQEQQQQEQQQQQWEEGGWVSGAEGEQEGQPFDPVEGEDAQQQSPSGDFTGEAEGPQSHPHPHDQSFFEEGEAEVELQEGEYPDQQGHDPQDPRQQQQLQQQPGLGEGEPSGYSPEYDTPAELMAGVVPSASAAAPGAMYGGQSGGRGYTAGADDSALQSPARGYSPGEGLEGDDTYGRTGGGAGSAAASPSRAGGYAGGYDAGLGGLGGDTDVMLALERERFSAQLQMEVRAREELEDMILRIEKHFKAEQAARKKAEELLQASIAAELEAKNRLEDVLKKRREEQKQMDEERNALRRQLEEERNGIKRERNALEGMRQDFEAELQAARAEVAKAQDALAASEDRIRAAEAVDRARLESEYQGKINSLQDEIGRLRDELTYRTQMMASEMTRWQQQAHLTAAAVMEAKNEVLERKKELDCTKEKMDRLLEKLYIGRERGIELSGAIAAAQSYAQHAGAHGGLASVAGMMPPALLMAGGPGGPGGARGAALLAALPPLPCGPGHSNIPKLPPLNARQPLFGDVGGGGGGGGAGPRRSAPGSQTAYDGAGGAGLFLGPGGMGPGGGGFMGGPPGMGPMGGIMGPMGMGPMGGMGMMGGGPMGGHMGSFGGSPPGGMMGGGSPGSPGGQEGGVDPYAHVQSRFAQPTEAALAKQEAAKKSRANGKGKKVDRFEEGKRDEARMAGMAKRWQ